MHKILLIEDEPSISEMYAYVLKKSNYNVDQAYNGADGLSKISHNTYDLILLDIMLPLMNGLDLLKSLKQQKIPLPPVILLSNMTHQGMIDTCMTLGAKGYVLKSNIIPSDLVGIVKNFQTTGQIPTSITQISKPNPSV